MSAIRKFQWAAPSAPVIPQPNVYAPRGDEDASPAAQKLHPVRSDLWLAIMVVSSVAFTAACLVYGLYPVLQSLCGL